MSRSNINKNIDIFNISCYLACRFILIFLNFERSLRMTSVYELSWEKISFLDKLHLFFKSREDVRQKSKSKEISEIADGFSSLSSAYYTIAGTGFSHLMNIRNNPIKLLLWCLTWLPLTTFCYMMMLPVSDKVEDLLGLESMSADQCDIRQSILRKRHRLLEAKECVFAALSKLDISHHTLGLIYAGLADIKQKMGKNSTFVIKLACNAADKAVTKEPLQADRIYKQCAAIAKNIGMTDLSNELHRKARDLAQKHNAKDQLLKISV